MSVISIFLGNLLVLVRFLLCIVSIDFIRLLLLIGLLVTATSRAFVDPVGLVELTVLEGMVVVKFSIFVIDPAVLLIFEFVVNSFLFVDLEL